MGEWIIEKIGTAFNYIFLIIDGAIFSILNAIYKIYIALASARLLTNGMFTEIANRFYAIIGVGMLFVMSYVVIQGIVNPDNFAKSGGEGSQLLKRIGIAVIGLALVPGAFRIAYTAQDVILSQNLIGKIFLGYDKDEYIIEHGDVSIDGTNLEFDSDGDGEADQGEINQNDAINTNAGTVTAMSIWQALFYPTNVDSEKEMDEAAQNITTELSGNKFIRGASTLTKFACGAAIAFTVITLGSGLLAAAALCGAAVATGVVDNLAGKEITLKQAYGAAAGSGDFTVFAGFAGKVAQGEITYKIPFSTIIGAVSVYLFLSFAIDMAVRAVKLVYMQIIAPVPLMLQILPKFKDNFNKWLKTVLSLFMEVFIRLTFVYIVAFLISHLMSIMNGGWLARANLNLIEKLFARIILIIGMLLFAKTAPQFISETLGISSGNLSLGIRKKLAESGVLSGVAAAGGIGANLLSGAFTIGRNRWKQNFDANGNFKDPKKSHARAKLEAFAAGVAGGFGSAIHSARRTILDSRNVTNYKDVRDRVIDSYNRGKNEIGKKEQKRQQHEDDLKAHGYNRGEKGERGLGRRIIAEFEIAGDKAKDFYLNEFSAMPYNYQPHVEINQVFEAAEKAGLEAALGTNQKYKDAFRELNNLDTQDGIRNQALKLAKKKGYSDEQLKELEESPEKLEAFKSRNYSELNEHMNKERKALEKKVKNAKEHAIEEELAKEALMGGGKVTDAMKKIFEDPNNANILKKYANQYITLPGDSTIKLSEYMTKKFGKDYLTNPNTRTESFISELTDKDVETDISLTFKDGTEGLVKFKNGEGSFYDSKGNLKGKIDLKDFDNKQLKVGKDTYDIDEINGISTIGKNVFANGENKTLGKGTILGLTEALGGSGEYVLGDGSRTQVTLNDDGGARIVTSVDGSSLGNVTLAGLGNSELVVGNSEGIQLKANLGGNEKNIKIQNLGGNIKAIVDGSELAVDASGNINLGNSALNTEIELPDLAGILNLGEGEHTINLGGSGSVKVLVKDGRVAGSSKVAVASGDAAKAAISGYKIDIDATGKGLKDGESITIGDYEVSNTSGTVKVKKGGKDFSGRATVDIDALDKLNSDAKSARIKLVNEAGTGPAREIAFVSDDSYTVLQDFGAGVSRADIVEGLANGESATFDLPADMGHATATKYDGQVRYIITKSDGSVSAPMTEAEFKAYSEDISINGSDIAAAAIAQGKTEIDVGGTKFGIRDLDKDEIKEYGNDQILVGNETNLQSILESGKEGIILFDNNIKVRVEKDGEKFKYIVVKGDREESPRTLEQLRPEVPELFGTRIDKVEMFEGNSTKGIFSNSSFASVMKEMQEILKRESQSATTRKVSDSSSDKK